MHVHGNPHALYWNTQRELTGNMPYERDDRGRQLIAAKAVNAYDAMFRACIFVYGASRPHPDKFGMVDEPLIDLGSTVRGHGLTKIPQERRSSLDMILIPHRRPRRPVRLAAPRTGPPGTCWRRASSGQRRHKAWRLSDARKSSFETFDRSENAYSYSFPRKSRWDTDQSAPVMPTMLEQTSARQSTASWNSEPARTRMRYA